MTEAILESEIKVKLGLLGTLNNYLLDQVSIKLSPEQTRKLRLNLKSIRGRKFVSPRDQTKCLQEEFDANIIDKLVENVNKVADSVEGEFKLGDKILEINPFQQALDREYRSLQIEDLTQQTAFNYWVRNFHKLPKNLSFKERIISTITSPIRRISDQLGVKELGFSWSLAKINSGIVIQNSPGLRKKVGNFLVNSSVNSSVKTQMRYDIQALAEITSEQKREQMRDEVVKRYGYGKDDLEVKVFSHPDYYPRLIRSGIMNATYYGGLRQILGWSAFAAMVKVPVPGMDVTIQIPGSVEKFQPWVDQFGFLPASLAAASILAGLMITRMGVDCYVLKKRDMTPDTFELGLALSAGRVDEYQNLRVNPKFGVTGPLFDVAISSTIFGAAFGVDLPYSIPAYLLAMGVDQLSFMGSNLGYLLWSRKNDNNRSIGRGHLDA